MKHFYLRHQQGLGCQVHVVGSSCFIALNSVCTQEFFLTDFASNMQMICSSFKVFVFLPVVFFGLGSWVCYMKFISDVLGFLVILTIQDPPKFFSCFCVLDTVKDDCVIVFEASVEFTVMMTVTSLWIESKSHPTYMNCLPRYPHINSRNLSMNQMTDTV